MWPFGKRLDDEQKRELREVAENLNDRRDGIVEAYGGLAKDAAELYQKCSTAAGSGTTPNVREEEVLAVEKGVLEVRALLDVMEEVLGSVALADWYPKNLRKTNKESAEWVEAMRISLGMVEEALEPPALVNAPGNNKPNVFTKGLYAVDLEIRHAPRFRSDY